MVILLCTPIACYVSASNRALVGTRKLQTYQNHVTSIETSLRWAPAIFLEYLSITSAAMLGLILELIKLLVRLTSTSTGKYKGRISLLHIGGLFVALFYCVSSVCLYLVSSMETGSCPLHTFAVVAKRACWILHKFDSSNQLLPRRPDLLPRFGVSQIGAVQFLQDQQT